MKVIFLDVDGVLNRYNSPSMYSIGKSKIRRFCRLVYETEAKIVLSSSWRMVYSFRSRIEQALSYRKLSLYSMTPYFQNEVRGKEIQAWLDEHRPDKYIILDDLPPTYFLENQWPYLINTEPNEGLTDEQCDKAKRILME